MSDDEKWSVRFRLTRFDIRRYIMVEQDALIRGKWGQEYSVEKLQQKPEKDS